MTSSRNTATCAFLPVYNWHFASILEPIIQPRLDENIVQSAPDKIPSFIPLQDDEPTDRVAQPFDEMSVAIEKPDSSMPKASSKDAPISLVNGKLDHEIDHTSMEAPLSEFNVTIPLTDGESPIKIVQKPVESVG